MDKLLLDTQVPFTVVKLLNVESIWIHENINDWLPNISTEMLPDTYGYVVPETECLEHCSFSFNDNLIAYAERYGGIGSASNGGGARCGNFNGVQVKGLGQSPVVGRDAERWHAHGNLALRVAVYEAIFSEVLCFLLPHGAAHCYGILGTGEETAYDTYFDDEEIIYARGALMLREICSRPAHFIPAGGFSVHPKYKDITSSDVARLRLLYKSLPEQNLGTKGFVSYLGKYLACCANQFACAKVNRIAHGALSPSNLSMDGKWLDLPKINFMSLGHNYTSLTTHWAYSFYDEPHIAVDSIREIIYAFNKYTNSNFNPSPLYSYFWSQFENCILYHTGSVFGFSHHQIISLLENDEYKNLSKSYVSLLNSGKEILQGDPDDNKYKDLMPLYLEHVFSNPLSSHENMQFSISQNHMEKILHTLTNGLPTPKPTVTSVILRALKRSYLHNFFYRARISKIGDDITMSKTSKDISDFIQSTIDTARWIYASGNKNVIIFQNKTEKLIYSPCLDAYEFHEIVGCTSFKNEKDLLKHIENTNHINFIIYDYDFKPYVVRLISYLENLKFKC